MPDANHYEHQRAPLYEGICRYIQSNPARLHVPGHKGASHSGIDNEYFRQINLLDVTEIPGLDDLHDPSGIIAEAETLAADYFGADHTFFLVQGSTVGNLALILAACQRGDKMIVQRNAHQSVIHGLMLAEAQAVFFHPSDGDEQLYEKFEQLLSLHSDAKAVFVTSPDYYGRTLNLRKLSKLAHRNNMLFFVDEAHGAHFRLHHKLPPTAMQCSADGAVQSTHKMLNSMTMTAMLHLKGTGVTKANVRNQLKMLQSSSPSYPLMASLDLSRRWAALYGQQEVERTLKQLQNFHKKMGSMPWYKFERNDDPYKLVLLDQTGTLDGFRLQEELAEEGCIVEMADPYGVVAAYSPAASENELLALERGLDRISERYWLRDSWVKGRKFDDPPKMETDKGNMLWATNPISFARSSLNRSWEEVYWEEAHGRLAAEMIVPYPPGIPLLFPGEIIERSRLEQLRKWEQAGARFPGMQGRNLDKIRVLKLEKKEKYNDRGTDV